MCSKLVGERPGKPSRPEGFWGTGEACEKYHKLRFWATANLLEEMGREEKDLVDPVVATRSGSAFFPAQTDL